MTEKIKNSDLISTDEIKKQVISTSNVDYLINKVKDNNVGIKIERKYPSGYSESLSVWDKSVEAVKEWKTIDISDTDK